MAEDISNRALVVLLVLAIAISLVGTMVSVGKLSGAGIGIITGRPVEAGTLDINITQLVQINVTQQNVNFGTGYITPGSENCVLTSGEGKPACWTNTTDYAPISFRVRNIGNVDTTIHVNTTEIATGLLGGTSPGYDFRADLAGADVSDVPGSTTDFTGFDFTGQVLVVGLSPEATNDEIGVDIRLTVPNDAGVGHRNDVITFLASATS